MRALTALFACLLFLSACETIEGAGRDIQNTGEAIEDLAE